MRSTEEAVSAPDARERMPATSPSQAEGGGGSRKRVLEGSSGDEDASATCAGEEEPILILSDQDQKKHRKCISVVGRALLEPTLEVLPPKSCSPSQHKRTGFMV